MVYDANSEPLNSNNIVGYLSHFGVSQLKEGTYVKVACVFVSLASLGRTNAACCFSVEQTLPAVVSFWLVLVE